MRRFFALTAFIFCVPLSASAADTYTVSRSDMNRIVCTGEVENVYVSEEKGLSVSTGGTDVYIKFPVNIVVDQATQEKQTHYTSAAAEVFIVCGSVTHSLILKPAKMPAQTIVLKKADDGVAEYKGKDEEETLSLMMKALVEESVPASFRKKEINRANGRKRGDTDMTVVTVREYTGGGYVLKEFHIFSASEVTLLPSELGTFEGVENPLASLVMSETFKGWVRGFVIERGIK